MLVKQVPGLGQESFEDDLDDATLRRLQEIAESMAEMSETLTETSEQGSGLFITLLAHRGALGFKLTPAPGLLVYRTQPGSWAEAAGLRHGDALLKVSNLEARCLTLGLRAISQEFNRIKLDLIALTKTFSPDFM